MEHVIVRPPEAARLLLVHLLVVMGQLSNWLITSFTATLSASNA